MKSDPYKVISQAIFKEFYPEKPITFFEEKYTPGRNNLKEIVFQYIWYAWFQRESKENVYFKIFGKEFPTVAKILNYSKVKGPGKFPTTLQYIEANIVLDKIGKKLMAYGISFLTIHDQILVNNDNDLNLVKKISKEVFVQQYGVAPEIIRKDFI